MAQILLVFFENRTELVGEERVYLLSLIQNATGVFLIFARMLKCI